MTTAEIRKAVREKYPSAIYLDLSDSIGPCHCVDARSIDKYLSYGASSRRRAWYEALKNIQMGLFAGRD